jgi:hypothetical protein
LQQDIYPFFLGYRHGPLVDQCGHLANGELSMTVPLRFFEGDTVSWDEKASSDYPATAWTLTYTFVNAIGVITAVATADDDDYTVSLSAAVTATYIPGQYKWVGKVSDIATGLEIHTVLSGETEIYRSLDGDTSGYDTRSWAQEALDAVTAVITNRATMDQEAYSIQGRSLSRTPMSDLITLRKYLQGEVSKEQDLVSDGPSSKQAHVRF